MDINQSSCVARHEFGRQYTHKACQHHQGRVVGINSALQRRVKGAASPKCLVINNLCCNTQRAGGRKAFSIWSVADDARHTGTEFGLPLLFLCRVGNSQHIGATSRDQNNNVFFTCLHSPLVYDHQNPDPD